VARILNDGLTIKLSEKEQGDVVTQVIKDVNEAVGERSDEESKWTKWENEQYLGNLPAKNFPWKNCSNINSEMTMEAVNDTWARIVKATFPYRPYVKVEGRGTEDKKKAPAVEDYWDYLSEEMPLKPEISLWFLETLKIGTGVVIEPYVEEKYTTREREKNKIIEKTGKGYVGPRIEVLDLKDFIIPKKSKGVQYPDSRFSCRVYRLYLDQIKQKEKEGKFINVDKLLEHIKKNKTDPNKQFELCEYWGRWVVDDNEEKGLERNVVFTVLKEEKILVSSTLFLYDHNCRPFHLINFLPKKNSIYGLGLCEMLTHIHWLETTIFNQMMDNATLVNSKVTVSRKGATDVVDTKLFPGANIIAEDIDRDIKPFDLGDLHISSFELLNVVRRYFERVTKVTDFTSGMRSSTGKGRTTASEVFALIRESDKWFNIILDRFLDGYKEVLKQGTALLQQYMPDEIKFQKAVMGEGKEIPFEHKITKEQIMGNFDYIPQAKTVIAEEIEERRALAFYDVAMNNPLIREQPELIKEVTQDLFISMGKREISKKLDEYYPTTPEQKKAAIEAKKREMKEQMELAEEMSKGLPLPPEGGMGGAMPPGIPPTMGIPR